MGLHRTPRSLNDVDLRHIYRTLLIGNFFISIATTFTVPCMTGTYVFPTFTLRSTVALPPLAWNSCLLKQRESPLLSLLSLPQHLFNVKPYFTCITIISSLLSVIYIGTSHRLLWFLLSHHSFLKCQCLFLPWISCVDVSTQYSPLLLYSNQSSTSPTTTCLP